jgi:pyruvate,water dikinase
METGGYLSHGAIVAREYGIPAVLNVPQAMQRIPDGTTITLDGGTGTIQLSESTSSH